MLIAKKDQKGIVEILKKKVIPVNYILKKKI